MQAKPITHFSTWACASSWLPAIEALTWLESCVHDPQVGNINSQESPSSQGGEHNMQKWLPRCVALQSFQASQLVINSSAKLIKGSWYCTTLVPTIDLSILYHLSQSSLGHSLKLPSKTFNFFILSHDKLIQCHMTIPNQNIMHCTCREGE